MDVVPGNTLLPGDPRLIDHIVCELKSQGIFDQFRKECIADVDTKPAYQNLRQRVEGSVTGFLKLQQWKPDMNKNQLREMLRKNIYESGFLETGVERIVDQVVNPKINSVFLPQVEEVVYKFLGLEKPNRNNAPKNPNGPLTVNTVDLLPTDLDPISPDSEVLDKALNKSDKTNESANLDDSKADDYESPPFEPITEQSVYMQIDENSNESRISGISGLTSHDSNASDTEKLNVAVPDVNNQDSQLSKVSSNSRLSIITTDSKHTPEKMDISDDTDSSNNNNFKIDEGIKELSTFNLENNDFSKIRQEIRDELEAIKYEINGGQDSKPEKTEETAEVKVKEEKVEEIINTEVKVTVKEETPVKIEKEESKVEEVKKSERHRSDSEKRRDKDKEKRSDKDKDRKHSGSKSSSSSTRDKDRHRDKSKDNKSREKDKSKDSKSRSHSSSKHSSRDRSSSKTDSKSSKDSKKSNESRSKKDSDDSKPRKSESKSSRDRSKSESSKNSSKDSKSSHKDQKDKKDVKKSSKREKDDHNSSRDKKPDNRRSADRDSNDGSSGTGNQSSNSTKEKENCASSSSKSKNSGSNSDSSQGSNESGQSDSQTNQATLEDQISQKTPVKAQNVELSDKSETEVVVPNPNESFSDLTITQQLKLKKPKFASNIFEARKLMKIRKKLEKLEKKRQKQLASKENTNLEVDLESIEDTDSMDSEKLQILETEDTKDDDKKYDVTNSSVVSKESWDAIEAKLSQSAYKNVDFDSYVDENCDSSSSKRLSEDEDCLYFNNQVSPTTERFLKSVETYQKNSEMDSENNMAPPTVEQSAKKARKPKTDASETNKKTVGTKKSLKGKKRKLEDENDGIYAENNNKKLNNSYNIVEVAEEFDEVVMEPSPSASNTSNGSIEGTNTRKTSANRKKTKKNSVSNSESFPLPLSPESDKFELRSRMVEDRDSTPQNKGSRISFLKSQRYSSDDLYKPRPFVSGTSRRQRRLLNSTDEK